MDEKLFDFIEKHYGEANDDTMINYERFCQDIDVVFNLPVIFFYYSGQIKGPIDQDS